MPLGSLTTPKPVGADKTTLAPISGKTTSTAQPESGKPTSTQKPGSVKTTTENPESGERKQSDEGPNSAESQNATTTTPKSVSPSNSATSSKPTVPTKATTPASTATGNTTPGATNKPNPAELGMPLTTTTTSKPGAADKTTTPAPGSPTSSKPTTTGKPGSVKTTTEPPASGERKSSDEDEDPSSAESETTTTPNPKSPSTTSATKTTQKPGATTTPNPAELGMPLSTSTTASPSKAGNTTTPATPASSKNATTEHPGQLVEDEEPEAEDTSSTTEHPDSSKEEDSQEVPEQPNANASSPSNTTTAKPSRRDKAKKIVKMLSMIAALAKKRKQNKAQATPKPNSNSSMATTVRPGPNGRRMITDLGDFYNIQKRTASSSGENSEQHERSMKLSKAVHKKNKKVFKAPLADDSEESGEENKYLSALELSQLYKMWRKNAALRKKSSHGETRINMHKSLSEESPHGDGDQEPRGFGYFHSEESIPRDKSSIFKNGKLHVELESNEKPLRIRSHTREMVEKNIDWLVNQVRSAIREGKLIKDDLRGEKHGIMKHLENMMLKKSLHSEKIGINPSRHALLSAVAESQFLEENLQNDLVSHLKSRLSSDPTIIEVLGNHPSTSVEEWAIAEGKHIEDQLKNKGIIGHANENANMYAFSTKNYESQISDATKHLGSVKVRWWEKLWPRDGGKNIERQANAMIPRMSFKDIIPKFNMYKNQLKILISRMVPSCPEVHSMKLLKTWGNLFRSAWPNLLEMTELSMKYAEDLKLQLSLCLDKLVHSKFGLNDGKINKIILTQLDSKESQESVKVKRQSATRESFIQNFNSELATPLVNYFAKMPEMVQGGTPALKRRKRDTEN